MTTKKPIGTYQLRWTLAHALPNEWDTRDIAHLKMFLNIAHNEHKTISWHAKHCLWAQTCIRLICDDLADGHPGSLGVVMLAPNKRDPNDLTAPPAWET